MFITERCLLTDYEVFAKMLRFDGQMDVLEFSLYKRWYDMVDAKATALSAIIYVDTQPELCVDRIKGRARDGEEGIPLSYLTSLDHFQSEMVTNAPVPAIRVTSRDVNSVNSFVQGVIDSRLFC